MPSNEKDAEIRSSPQGSIDRLGNSHGCRFESCLSHFYSIYTFVCVPIRIPPDDVGEEHHLCDDVGEK